MQKISLFCLCTVLVFAGCGDRSGPALAPVSGTVTLYGKPVTNAVVTFSPDIGGPAAISKTDADGKYELWSAGKKGAVISKHKVAVSTIMEPEPAQVNPSDLKSDDPKYAEMMANPNPYKKIASKKDPIPAKYNTQTELSFEVNSGSNTINIDLK